jgi:hypothetical protein
MVMGAAAADALLSQQAEPQHTGGPNMRKEQLT